MIASSIFTPPMRMERDVTTPPRLMTAASVVPPPTSTTMEPMGSKTGRPLPIAAAKGFSTRCSWPSRTPAYTAALRMARRSMGDMRQGTVITARGLTSREAPIALRTKYCSMYCVISKSRIMPSAMGRTAVTSPDVRPSKMRASSPMARMACRPPRSTTRMEGSSITIPFFFTYTCVLAVPRSMPISGAMMAMHLQSIPYKFVTPAERSISRARAIGSPITLE